MTQEQMEACTKLAAPGTGHEILKAMAGDFRADVTFVMMGQEQKSTGMMHNTLELGGRYLLSRYAGDGDGMAGIGQMGFDNGSRKYVGSWVDTMSTKMMVSEGTADPSGKVITCTAPIDDPMSGRKIVSRNVTTVIDNNRHTYEMFMPGPDGNEHKCLSITYTRVK